MLHVDAHAMEAAQAELTEQNIDVVRLAYSDLPSVLAIERRSWPFCSQRTALVCGSNTIAAAARTSGT